MKRRQFIQNATLASGALMASPLLAGTKDTVRRTYSLEDLHVHTTDKFSIENIVEVGQQKNIRFGVVDHPEWAFQGDEELRKWVENLRKYPVYVGLQPMTIGWSKKFSPDALALVDYVLMDPQMFEKGNTYGDRMLLWNLDTYVDDEELFMEKYVERSLEVINNPEPLDVFGWPLFLPPCIAPEYYRLWTEERMLRIIDAAKKNEVAIEINDLAHTPHEKFIRMAKEQGLKFTFGSDTRNEKTGRLDYCKRIADTCKLEESDFFRPTSPFHQA
ncbi:MAG: hypothetical protein R2751_07145 [Bacteroidales bacterium]